MRGSVPSTASPAQPKWGSFTFLIFLFLKYQYSLCHLLFPLYLTSCVTSLSEWLLQVRNLAVMADSSLTRRDRKSTRLNSSH